MTEKTVYICDFCGAQLDENVPHLKIPCGSKSEFVVQDKNYHNIVESYETLHFCDSSHIKGYIDKSIEEKKE